MNTITVEELQAKLEGKEPLVVLDVRPEEERMEWSIPESQRVNVYERLKSGDLNAMDNIDIPTDTTVVTVCAAGRTSLIAADLLARKGIPALSLKGGMKAWNYAWNTAEITLPSGVTVLQVRRPAKGVLSYVVGSKGEAVVIDAALDPRIYLDIAGKRSWDIRYVLDTHVHADFVSRSRELAAVTGATHLMHADAGVSFPVTTITDGDEITFGGSSLKVLHTPGHTWDSTSFVLENQALFTGDTLFVDGIGRPDLKAEGDEASRRANALYISLEKLFAFAPGALVLPAHSSGSVPFDGNIIAEELSLVHDRVKDLIETQSGFVNYALGKIPPTPPNYKTIATLNKTGSHEGYILQDIEAGGNHCAIG